MEGSFDDHHNLLGGNLILAMVAYNSNIFGSHGSLVVCIESYWIGQSGKTGERLDIVVAEEDY